MAMFREKFAHKDLVHSLVLLPPLGGFKRRTVGGLLLRCCHGSGHFELVSLFCCTRRVCLASPMSVNSQHLHSGLTVVWSKSFGWNLTDTRITTFTV